MHYSNFSRLARVGSSVSLGIDTESSNYDVRERRRFVLARRYTGIMDGSLDLRDLSWHRTRFAEKWRSTCKYKKVRGLGPRETRVFPVRGHRAEKNGDACPEPLMSTYTWNKVPCVLWDSVSQSFSLEFEQESMVQSIILRRIDKSYIRNK